jgi:alpha-1,6-mannosyltransferase
MRLLRVSRHGLVRYTGLAGATLLATSAYLGGALPPQLRVDPDRWMLLYLFWLTGTSILVWAWWAGRQGVPSARWAAITGTLWSIPLLAAPPLGSQDVYSYACVGFTYAAGLDPYVNSVSTLPCPWLEAVAPIWRDTPSPYGPLFVLLSGAMVSLGGTLVASVALFRAIAVVGVGLTALSLPALARRCGIPEGQAVWLAVASPLVVIHQVSGAHNDALMVGLLVAGLALVVSSGGRTLELVGGGALLGLAGAVKATAWVAVPFAALAAIAGPYCLRSLIRCAGLIIGGMTTALVGVMFVSGLSLGWVGGLMRSGDAVGWTAPAAVVGTNIERLAALLGLTVPAVAASRLTSIAPFAGILIVLWWRARQGDAVYRAGLALAAAAVLAPRFHPWYATWPLAVLAATVSRIRWLLLPCVVACFVVLPDGQSILRSTRLPGELLLIGLIAWVGVLGVRRLRS